MLKRRNCNLTISGSIPMAAAGLAVMSWFAMSLPGAAFTIIPTEPYRNEYRLCTGRLLKVGITADDAANTCSLALRPSFLAECVVKIKQQTRIAAIDALGTCRQARRPNELAACVVGINRTIRGAAEPTSLDYCLRSLLPLRFAECVVGLRLQIAASPRDAMNTCIDASDRLPLDVYPNFVPQEGTPPIQAPPIPVLPVNQGGVTPTLPEAPPSNSGTTMSPN